MKGEGLDDGRTYKQRMTGEEVWHEKIRQNFLLQKKLFETCKEQLKKQNGSERLAHSVNWT